jgi:hypothetical protein
MENKEIKLTEEELKSIESLRSQYGTITARLGQLKIEQMLVGRQLSRLQELEKQMEAEYTNTQLEEEQFAKTINEKYGTGNINLESGVFTPSSPSV